MNKAIQLLSGIKILEVANSPINGRLVAVKDFAWGVHIQANGLTQSGGVAEHIWKHTLNTLKNRKVDSVLILGLGGGSIAKITRKIWPNAKIVGVDIDPEIVQMGKEYMNLDAYNVDVHIVDAFEFCQKTKQKFDLICVDTYQGDQFPEIFAGEDFFAMVKKLLTHNGVVVFNRLYYGEKRKLAVKMISKLEKVFDEVNPVYPEANVMLICK